MPSDENSAQLLAAPHKTLIMGVLNVTPDSFSDGGLYADLETAVARAHQMILEGADVLDIGGESTRPATFRDDAPLSPEEEIKRILPVIQRLKAELPRVPISVDTYKSEVAQAALEAGASLINDISGLTFDPQTAPLAAHYNVPIIIMHLLGRPRNIPRTPIYLDVIGDISAFFQRQIGIAKSAGVRDEQIWLDPGIGFGKTTKHNLEILRRLSEFKALGYPLVVGASRKRFLGQVLGTDDPNDRIEGTAATVALSIAAGATMVRVHDVRAMARVARMSDAIVHGWAEGEEPIPPR